MIVKKKCVNPPLPGNGNRDEYRAAVGDIVERIGEPRDQIQPDHTVVLPGPRKH